MAKKTDESVNESSAVPAQKITQKEVVKRAIAAGKDSPSEGVQFVMEHFGITGSNQSFSTIKSQIKKAGGNGNPSAPLHRPAAPVKAANPVHSSTPADLARAVKALVQQHGVEAVKSMPEVFED